jgi:hypothetical protein
MLTKKKTPERYIDILKISKRCLVLLGSQEAVTERTLMKMKRRLNECKMKTGEGAKVTPFYTKRVGP